MSVPFLDQYETLDVIGNGSFGIIRKVRRKSDGLMFARKELNFGRMTERDKKQIVAEVNILKDLTHDHIVRYHDRFTDRDAGILYIVMEYCGGGDLSTVINHATKTNRPIPEEKIWAYFLQILLALNHCHHPNGHTRGTSGSGTGVSALENVGTTNTRAQILHRDLKPDNVFLDVSDKVKLGDFGLSRTLSSATFASTYVGTPYYMSPELMQEKAYDSKSDIWSLGCVIYELCALKPPFHEARTHQELNNCIRNGRIPPLPRGYSQTLASVIKSMLNLNPAMRPSAAQLLQHERLSLTQKVIEAEKILVSVKSHRADVAAKEHELNLRESLIREREQQVLALVGQKDAEIAKLQQVIREQQTQHHQNLFSQQQVEAAAKEAVARREDELRVLVMKREKEVAEAIARREEEIMMAVRKREEEVSEAWVSREAEIRKEFEEKAGEVKERINWIQSREEELKAEEARLDIVRVELEERTAKLQENAAKGRREKMPLEEVKNVLAPLSRLTEDTPQQRRRLDNPTPKPPLKAAFPSLSTPIARPAQSDVMASAMKGVILTSTGEALTTPAPTELTSLFNNSPKVGLNFTKIFDFEDGDEDEDDEDIEKDSPTFVATEQTSPPPSPSSRKQMQRARSRCDRETSSDESSSTPSNSSSNASNAPPTRLRRPSIRSSNPRPPSVQRSATLPIPAASEPMGSISASGSSSTSQLIPKPLPHPHLNTVTTRVAVPIPRLQPGPEYDLADEENLPSPFIKRNLTQASATRATAAAAAATVRPTKRRQSNAQTLRAVAVVNAAGKCIPTSASSEDVSVASPTVTSSRSALASARKASEEARKALLRS